MNDRDLPLSEDVGRGVELRHYVKGFGLALVLTLAAFAAVTMLDLPMVWTTAIIFALALIQIIVHFHYFLHIDLAKSHRNDLLLILFTGLIIFLMVAGSLWILFNLSTRMLS